MGKELFYLDQHGKKQDASLHRELLNNAKAKRSIAKIAIRKAIAEGMSTKVAVKLFKYREKPSPFYKVESRATDWWNKLNREEQLVYLKVHPHSIYKNKVKNEPIDNELNLFDEDETRILENVGYRSNRANAVKAWMLVLPKVDPNKLEKAFGKGCRISSITNFGFDPENTENEVSLTIHNNDFVAERTFERTSSGSLSVKHDIFEVHENSQGKGIAKEFLKNCMEIYKHLGVKSIKLGANIDVGGYAWAKYGWSPSLKSWSKLSSRITNILHELYKNKLIDRETFLHTWDIVASDDPKSVWKIADLTIPVQKDGKTISLGKYLLMDSLWWGELKLDDEDGMKRFNTYVNGKK